VTRGAIAFVVGAALATAVLLPAGAWATPKVYQCQKPVRTGVEVGRLHNITPARACPVALALFAWETHSAAHQKALYGCRRPQRDGAGYPYLKLHRWRGWRLSLVGKPYGVFTMSRGKSSFGVGGTDFPLNCS
jgi:hypothetical protein